MFLFISGNDLFRSKNFRDERGNLHGHRVTKRLEDRQVKNLMSKYKGLMEIAKAKDAIRIVIVPPYLRNVEKICKETYKVCSEQKLVHRFTISYSKKIIAIALKNVKRLAKRIELDQNTISLNQLEQICIGRDLNTKHMSKLEITRRILGNDDVHYNQPCYHYLGQFLSSYEWKK